MAPQFPQERGGISVGAELEAGGSPPGPLGPGLGAPCLDGVPPLNAGGLVAAFVVSAAAPSAAASRASEAGASPRRREGDLPEPLHAGRLIGAAVKASKRSTKALRELLTKFSSLLMRSSGDGWGFAAAAGGGEVLAAAAAGGERGTGEWNSSGVPARSGVETSKRSGPRGGLPSGELKRSGTWVCSDLYGTYSGGRVFAIHSGDRSGCSPCLRLYLSRAARYLARSSLAALSAAALSASN